MDIKKLVESLNPTERKVVKVLDNFSSFYDIVKVTELKEVEVMRALQWLQNKNIIKIKEDQKEIVALDENGQKYLKEGLPERKFLKALEKSDSIPNLAKKSGLSKEEMTISLGVLKSKMAIEITKTKEIIVSITDQGKHLLEHGFPEEQFLKEQFPKELDSLKEEEKFMLNNLRKRKRIVRVDMSKIVNVELTEVGKKLIKEKIDEGLIEKVSPSLIKSGAWKGKKFRRFDIKINVPPIFAGRKQHYRRFLDEVRQKFTALGFQEMTGPIVETDFWDMDALFLPQFHAARDIHQAYYIKEPKYSKLDKNIVDRVKQAHENGIGTGSKGWQYKFDVKRTHRNMLRTQGTACSARMLANKDLKIPGKYFSIARVFRPDVIDATHLADFYQTEGIVVEEGLNFRHLKGLLKMFAEEFAKTDQIKITPGYFPFTEPSAELHAKHPDLGWIELAGSGVLRPEVSKPLVGKEISVLAWGIGIDRIAMFNLGIKDIRQLFSHDLEFLRNAKVV
jgi:phenylalanyl-tRNA synthetase alpha chain|tara:strand:- start:5210 stop:6727 length:1518 start_codon:yes stop_codon:yes gene_type:complete